MIGTQADAARISYNFCLNDHVLKDDQLRGIDRHLDLDGVRTALKPFCGSACRPSVDPELIIRMLLTSCCLGIRSERRLCEEALLNLACRLLRRLGLSGKVPDQSRSSKNRRGPFRESDILRQLFQSIVRWRVMF
jgi:transposase